MYLKGQVSSECVCGWRWCGIAYHKQCSAWFVVLIYSGFLCGPPSSRSIFSHLSVFPSHYSSVEADPPNVIFGQPLSKLLPQDQVKSLSGSSTPVPSVPSPQPRSMSINGTASVSPTSTCSDTSYLDVEPNPTSLLLEALDAVPPSPKARRRMSLCPPEQQVPDIVKKAIHYLDTKGVKTEGIFRIPGAKTRIDEVRLSSK